MISYTCKHTYTGHNIPRRRYYFYTGQRFIFSFTYFFHYTYFYFYSLDRIKVLTNTNVLFSNSFSYQTFAHTTTAIDCYYNMSTTRINIIYYIIHVVPIYIYIYITIILNREIEISYKRRVYIRTGAVSDVNFGTYRLPIFFIYPRIRSNRAVRMGYSSRGVLFT